MLVRFSSSSSFRGRYPSPILSALRTPPSSSSSCLSPSVSSFVVPFASSVTIFSRTAVSSFSSSPSKSSSTSTAVSASASIVPPYSITLLARNEQNAHDAYQAFTEGLGFPSAWEPKSSKLSDTSGTSSTLVSSAVGVPTSSSSFSSPSLSHTPYIEIISLPDIQWRWNDPPNKSPSRIRLLSYNIGASSSTSSSSLTSLPWLDTLLTQYRSRQKVSSFLSNINLSSSWTNQFAIPLPGPYINLYPSSITTDRTATPTTKNLATTADRTAGPYTCIQEIVLGLANPSLFDTCQSTLESINCHRNASFPSLWHPHYLPSVSVPSSPSSTSFPFPALDRSESNNSGPTLRLLPGKYSAMILNHSIPSPPSSSSSSPSASSSTILKEREEYRQYFLDRLLSYATKSSSTPTPSIISMYGEKKGLSGSCQTLLRLPSLEGLDLRLNDLSTVHQSLPCFNEPPETMMEHIDPSLNPAVDDPSRQVSMGCPSVVAMEVKSTIRLRLGFLN